MKRGLLIWFFSFIFTTYSLASTPLWTFTPMTPTTVSVSGLNFVEVEYLITNQSYRSHTITVQRTPFRIVSSGPFNCGRNFVLGPKESCILDIFIDGIGVADTYREGPELCESGTPTLCYTPSEQDILTVIYKE